MVPEYVGNPVGCGLGPDPWYGAMSNLSGVQEHKARAPRQEPIVRTLNGTVEPCGR